MIYLVLGRVSTGNQSSVQSAFDKYARVYSVLATVATGDLSRKVVVCTGDIC